MPKTLLVFVAGILLVGFELESWSALTAHLEENGLPMQQCGDKKKQIPMIRKMSKTLFGVTN